MVSFLLVQTALNELAIYEKEFLFVELCHGQLNADTCKMFDHFHRSADQPGQLRQLVVIESTEHIIYLLPLEIIIPDSEPKTWISGRSKHQVDVFQPVMTCVPSFGAKPDGPERQSDIVQYHQQVFHRDLQGLKPIGYRLSAQIHISGGLDHMQYPALQTHFGIPGVPFQTKRSPVFTGQLIGHHESDIMPGVCVFLASVPQSRDKKLHSTSILHRSNNKGSRDIRAAL